MSKYEANEKTARAHRVMAAVGIKDRCGNRHDACLTMQEALERELSSTPSPSARGEERATPGLYEHYKGNRYRVLTRAKLEFGSRALEHDCDVILYVVPYLAADATGVNIRVCRPDHVWREHPNFGPPIEIFQAKNSTDGPTTTGCILVVYVSLSGDGRVSVREEREFLADVTVHLVGSIGEVKVPRFKKIGP